MDNYWEKRTKRFGHTGWKDSAIYIYDQEVRLRVIKYIIEQYGQERKSALDYGGGVGDFSILLSELYDKVIYYDISEMVSNIAKEKINKTNVIFSDANRIFSEKYDMIICITVLQHIKDDKELLELMRKFKSALNENGKVVILDSGFAEKEHDTEYIRFREINSFYKLIEDSGFSIQREWGFYHPIDEPTREYQEYRKNKLVKLMYLMVRLGFSRTALRILEKQGIHKKYISDIESYIHEPARSDSSRIFVLTK